MLLVEALLGVIECLAFFFVLFALLGEPLFQLLALLVLLEKDMSSSLSSLSLFSSFKVSIFLGIAWGFPSESELFMLLSKSSLSDEIQRSSDNDFGFADAVSDMMGNKSILTEQVFWLCRSGSIATSRRGCRGASARCRSSGSSSRVVLSIP